MNRFKSINSIELIGIHVCQSHRFPRSSAPAHPTLLPSPYVAVRPTRPAPPLLTCAVSAQWSTPNSAPPASALRDPRRLPVHPEFVSLLVTQRSPGCQTLLFAPGVLSQGSSSWPLRVPLRSWCPPGCLPSPGHIAPS